MNVQKSVPLEQQWAESGDANADARERLVTFSGDMDAELNDQTFGVELDDGIDDSQL